MKKYNDMKVDYPQSTLLYFNTQTVIANNPGVKGKLCKLQQQYPIKKTLDQPYFALYYTIIRPIWEEFPKIKYGENLFYDYCHKRPGFQPPPILLSKHPCFGLM